MHLFTCPLIPSFRSSRSSFHLIMSTQSRKRRHGDDDNDDALPISKRINRLQIESQESLEINNNSHLHSSPPCNSLVNGYASSLGANDDVQAEYNAMNSTSDTSSNIPQSCLQPPCNLSPNIPRVNQIDRQSQATSWDQQLSQAMCLSGLTRQNNLHQSHSNDSNIVSQNLHTLDNSECYSPDLDSEQNPFYYDINRILYEANISRLLRANSLVFPPNK